MADDKPAAPLYRVRGLDFSYRLGKQPVPALHAVDLDVPAGDFMCLSGPSGSGKTTLLNVLGLVEPVQEGEVTLDGQGVKALAEAERCKIRRYKIGFVFQTFQLFPILSAAENVEYFLTRQKVPRAERATRVREALEAVGLTEHAHKRPLEMSGGQRQRVGIARAIAKRPQVIIADEPTASLDQQTGRDIMQILKDLNLKKGVTLVISSHDPMVRSFCAHEVKLVDGRIAGGGA